MDIREILSKVDHTLLSQSATWDEIKAICDDGMKYGCASVCIPASYVRQAVDYVDGKLPICTVIGFPNGYSTTAAKCFEANDAVKNGAEEIDMVINIGLAKMGSWDLIEEEIRAVVNAAKGNCVKVILENCYLTEDEIKQACEACVRAKATFVKTSTGFGTSGAKAGDVKLMRETVGDELGVKAAGGIRDRETVLAMIEAGANRLGCSAGIQIIAG